MKALLIIDMQAISFTPATPRYETDAVVARINALAAQFRTQGDAVIYIQHDGTKEGDCLPNTEEWALLSSLEVVPSDDLVSKTANDCFYQSNLAELLQSKGIQELWMTGCATDFCVDATIQSALAKDYQITVVQDAHTTADRPNLMAKTVIDYYNWKWDNMIPTAGSLQVTSFDELMAIA